LLLDVRGDEKYIISRIAEFIFRLVLILKMAENSKSTHWFEPNQHVESPGHVQLNPRIAAKVQENPVDTNNLGQWGGRCLVNQNLGIDANSNYPSIDAMSNSVSKEFGDYQKSIIRSLC